jgi:hypothetical protein
LTCDISRTCADVQEKMFKKYEDAIAGTSTTNSGD